MKKWTLLALALCLAIPLFCSAEAIDYSTWTNEDYEGEVEIWVDGTWESDGATYFNDYYPNIEMNYVNTAGDGYLTKIQTLVASDGELPDIVWLEATNRPALIALDIFENLEAAPYNLDRSLLLDYAIPLNSDANGNIVSLSLDPGAGGIAYRRSLAENYLGTSDPNELSAMLQSWDDVIAAAQKVTEASGGAAQLFNGIDDVNKTLLLLDTAPYVKDGAFTGEGILKERFDILARMKAVNGFGSCAEMSPAWHASYGSDQYLLFTTPQWIITYQIYGATDTAGDWGLIPWFGNGIDQGGSSYGITKTSDNKMAAWKYLEWYMLSKEGAESLRDVNGNLTAYKPVYEIEGFYSKPDDFFAGQDVLNMFAEFALHTTPRSATPYDAIVSECANASLSAIAEGAAADAAYDIFLGNMKVKAPELSY